MPSNIAIALVGVGAAYILLRALLHFTHDAREPRAVATSIPFISPLIGMLLFKVKFYVRLRDEHADLPIFTLRMPGSRVYVVTSTSLVPVVQRQTRAIAFAPIEALAAANVMGLTAAGNEILSADMLGPNFPGSYLGTFVKAIHPAMSPGAGLDAINRASVQVISASFDRLAAQNGAKVDFFHWLRHEIFMATTDAAYGPGNIFRDPALEDAWHTFEEGIMYLMMKLSPRFVAKDSYRARESLVPHFERYFGSQEHLRGSLLVQCRYDHNRSHGLGLEDVARTEIGQVSASVTNTIPAAFWLAYHILSDPAVLAACRREVAQIVQTSEDGRVCTVDLSHLKAACPVLVSTWQETLRYEHTGISARILSEDHLLDDKYLLKKDSTLMIVSSIQHSDTAAWGESATQFRHERFVKTSPKAKRANNPHAFRGFGGGATLCPGRHWVSTEILSFVALLLLRFDVVPTAPGRRWGPVKKATYLTASLPMPETSIEVEIVPRGDQEWRVLLSGSDKGLPSLADEVPL